jgi:hypothetical protein
MARQQRAREELAIFLLIKPRALNVEQPQPGEFGQHQRVDRGPLRFRYRLYGTALVNSLHREMTGQWLDEAQPRTVSNPIVRDRFRFVAETGRPTWRRGKSLWDRDPLHPFIETCYAPLAADGTTVDKIMGVAVLFDSAGKEIPG